MFYGRTISQQSAKRTKNHSMIHIKHVTKIFGTETALDQFSLHIQAGKLTVLIGPSGCGKSTLLKLLMGLDAADSGDIQWNSPMNAVSSQLELRRKIGYVIQEGGLFPHLSAKKNVTLAARFLGWDPEKINSRIFELCDLVQLDVAFLEKYPVQLSGGQRQRISLMRALMLDPAILMLDEPLGALDPLVRADLQKDLKEIFQRLKKTVILVTHDMGEAAYFADNIVLMRHGQIIQQGSVRELIDRPADPFVSQFINAQRNPLSQFLEGR